MSDSQDRRDFELIFEGPEDASPDTLRKLKAAFLVDLNLSIERVQEILSAAPLTILRSPDEDELAVYYHTIKNAGGKVLLLKHSETKIDAEEEKEETGPEEIEFTLDVEEFETDEKDEGEEIEVDLTGESEDLEPKAPKTYHLSLDDEEDEPLIPETVLSKNKDEEPEAVTEEEEEEEDEPLFNTELLEKAKASLPELPPLDLSFSEAEETLVSTTPVSPVKSASPAVPQSQTPPTTQETESFDLTIDTSEELVTAEEHTALSHLLEECAEETSTQSSHQLAKHEPQNPAEEPMNLTLSFDDAPYTPPAEKKVEAPKPTAPEQPGKNDAPAGGGLSFELDSQEGSKAPEQKHASPPPPQKVEPKTPEAPPAAAALEVEKSESKPLAKPAAVKPAETKPIEAKPAELKQAPSPQVQAPLEPEIRTKPSRRRRRIKLSPEILIPVLIGGVILAVANWFYFSGEAPKLSPAETKRILDEQKKKTEELQKKDEAKKAAASVKPLSNDFFGKSELADRTIEGTFTLENENTLLATIKIETPEPPALTPEEIVRHEPPHIWLRKVEIERVHVTLAADGTFSEKPGARIYIQNGEDGTRVIGSALLEGTFDKVGRTVDLKVSVTYGSPPSGTDLAVIRESESAYSARVAGTLLAAAQ